LEGREDSGDLLGRPEGLRGEQAEAEGERDVRQAPLRPHGAPHPRQPEQRDLLEPQAQEQEAAAVPRGDLGRGVLVAQRPRTIAGKSQRVGPCPHWHRRRRA
jgi:hypothetical protein